MLVDSKGRAAGHWRYLRDQLAWLPACARLIAQVQATPKANPLLLRYQTTDNQPCVQGAATRLCAQHAKHIFSSQSRLCC